MTCSRTIQRSSTRPSRSAVRSLSRPPAHLVTCWDVSPACSRMCVPSPRTHFTCLWTYAPLNSESCVLECVGQHAKVNCNRRACSVMDLTSLRFHISVLSRSFAKADYRTSSVKITDEGILIALLFATGDGIDEWSVAFSLSTSRYLKHAR